MAHLPLDPLLPLLAADPDGQDSASDQKRAKQVRVMERILTHEELKARLSDNPDVQVVAICGLLRSFFSTPDAALNDQLQEITKVREERQTVNYRQLGQRAAPHMAAADASVTSEIDLEQTLISNRRQGRQIISRLRDGWKERQIYMEKQGHAMIERMTTVVDHLTAVHERLFGSDDWKRRELREHTAVQILNLVRCGASRLMTHEYGAGIIDADLDEMEKLLLDFARTLPSPVDASDGDLRHQMARILMAIKEYDGSLAADAHVLEVGARLVIALVGAKHVLSLIAQLNVIVIVYDQVQSRDFVEEMERLAAAFSALRDDDATSDLYVWIRGHFPEKERLPGPNRFSSYCRGNAIIRGLESCLKGDDVPLPRIQQNIDAVKADDGGFEQIAWYALASAAVQAQKGDDGPLRQFLKKGKPAEIVEIAKRLAEAFPYTDLRDCIANQLSSLATVSPAGRK